MTEHVITIDRVDEMIRVVFRGLLELGGRSKPKELFALIEPRLNLSEHERGVHKSGRVRWETLLRWYSIDCAKAGFLERSSGYWVLTPAGEQALSLPSGQLVRNAQKMYRAWRSQRDGAATAPAPAMDVVVDPIEPSGDSDRIARQAVYEQAVETASDGIEDHINQLGPFEFQNLVAELLRGMGYHVPHVAAPGPDGGVDLLAYRDPLGTTTPRIKAQVKHREQKANVRDVRELEGLLRGQDDVGLLISSGGFSSDAQREARASHKHIELMDLERFVELWQEHYLKLRDQGRALLPLVSVHFLAPRED